MSGAIEDHAITVNRMQLRSTGPLDDVGDGIGLFHLAAGNDGGAAAILKRIRYGGLE